MSHAKILIRALPNVEFVHGFPGIPAGPERPHASIRGTVEVRLGDQPLKAKWVQVELRKIESITINNRVEEFMDSVGQSPVIVWQAKDEEETLSSTDFPFNIRVPETIPPSVALERGAGIKYEVVATLCTKGKKGLFRKESSMPISHSVSVVIDKHELHSTWPIYAKPESRHVVSNGLILAVDRSNTCFAPGDPLSVLATLKSDNLSPVVLRGFEFSLIETIIYRAGPPSQGKKHGPMAQTNILGEHKFPVSVTLYGGTQYKAELGCIIPANHTTSSVNTGRHIDITYSVKVKATIDMANTVVIDLPVTITNWPRQVSTEMIRRIGMAPNLSLSPTSSPRPPTLSHTPPRPPTLSHTLESRSGHTSRTPRSVSSDVLPSVLNGGGSHGGAPPASLHSGPLGTSDPSQVANALNTYSRQPNSYSNQVQASQRRPSTAPSPPMAFSGDTQVISPSANTTNIPNDFGLLRQSAVVAATVPSRPTERHDFGSIDESQKPASINHRPSQSLGNVDADLNRASQYSLDTDIRASVVSSPSMSASRRPRASSRTLKVMNADDIPEEESPIKRYSSPTDFNDAPRPNDDKSASPPPTRPWPTADEEKQRLYERAKAKAESTQALARLQSGRSSQIQSAQPSNANSSPPLHTSPASPDQANRGERSRTVSPVPVKTPWLTAEEEKERLFANAQAKVRQTQGLIDKPSSSTPSNSPASHPIHHKATPANSAQDSQRSSALTAYTTSSPPKMSAGAALYSHAMASINRPASAITPYVPQATLSTPRRNASHTGAGSTGVTPSPKHPTSANADKSALQYYEALKAVQRRHREERQAAQVIPQEGPIPYEELFRGTSNAAQSSGTSAVPSAPATILQRSTSVRSMMSPGPGAAVSEKEVLRRAFEARDAAIVRSGQTPPPIMLPSFQPSPAPRLAQTSLRSSSFSGRPSSSTFPTQPGTLLSEKEKSKRAFENRDRYLAAQQAPQPPQQAPLPPGYDESPQPAVPELPPPVPSESAGGMLSAAEEKAQLKARYDAEDAGAAPQSHLTTEAPSSTTPPPQLPEPSAAPKRELSLKSDSSETFLRRDPSISAGKKRASQMVAPPPVPSLPTSPPPLPPRPPAEYIEETRQEDRKNSILASVMLPPSDFSSSFDLGFDSFGEETVSSPNHSGSF